MARRHLIHDPQRPKRYIGSFLMFYLKVRAGIHHDHPQWGPGRCAKEAAGLWRKLPDKYKEQYIKKAEIGRTKYTRRMKTYHKKRPTQDMLHAKWGTVPKRFCSGWVYFIKVLLLSAAPAAVADVAGVSAVVNIAAVSVVANVAGSTSSRATTTS
jgi:hypothetical protein